MSHALQKGGAPHEKSSKQTSQNSFSAPRSPPPHSSRRAIASAQDDLLRRRRETNKFKARSAAINGTWNIDVNDANGYRDSVELHQGTIINPTGLRSNPA